MLECSMKNVQQNIDSKFFEAPLQGKQGKIEYGAKLSKIYSQSDGQLGCLQVAISLKAMFFLKISCGERRGGGG